MINIVSYWYLELIIAVIQVHAPPSQMCSIKNTTDGKLYANCFKKFLKYIPKNLGANLKILNISVNPFKQLKKIDTEPYPELIELNMKYIKQVTFYEFQPDFLEPLQKLEILHISGTEVQLPPLNLPPSITTVYANEVPRTMGFIDFSVLTKLKHIELNNCSLHGLPPLSKEAPLAKLHVEYNFMNKLKYTDLAPYCLLKEFYMNVTDLSKNHMFGQCCDILIWLEEHNVENNVECEINSFSEPCDLEKFLPDPQASVVYDQCLIRNGLLHKFPYKMIFAIFISLMVILLVGFGGYKFYQFYKSRKAARLKEGEKSQ